MSTNHGRNMDMGEAHHTDRSGNHCGLLEIRERSTRQLRTSDFQMDRGLYQKRYTDRL